MSNEIEPYDVVIFDLDKPNKNGRVYSTDAMQKAIDDLDGKPLLGCIGMNNTGFELVYGSHEITNLHIEGDRVIGTIKVLDTPEGLKLKTLLISGYDMVYRSSGFGTMVEQTDGTFQVEDFKLIAVNAVDVSTAA